MNKQTDALKVESAAIRVLDAWDTTVLPKSNDGMMQERMECLREALADHIRDATKMIEQPDYRAVKTWHDGKPVYVAEPPCKTGSQCTSKCQQCEQTAQEPVAYSYTSRITGAQGFSHHPMPRFIDAESWDIKPLYTSPPASKPWIGLTEEDRVEIWKKSSSIDGAINATESKLREKNAQPSKPLTDEQIIEMYNEPRSDAEMLEFARAIEAAHGITGEQK